MGMTGRGIYAEQQKPNCDAPLKREPERKSVVEVMQGDAYPLPISLYDRERQTEITPEIAEDVEITIGGITKSVADGKVFYNEERWIYPLTQDDTFSWRIGEQPIQGRVKFIGGEVKGVDIGVIVVKKSESREVL